jgi:hypothetical protein
MELNSFAQSTNVSEYSYEGGRLHLKGKGFLGFTSQCITNGSSSTKVVNTNEIDIVSLRGSTQKTILSTITGENLKSTENFFETHKQGNNYFTSLTRTVENDYLSKNVITSTYTYQTDASGTYTGNITSVKKDYGDDYTEQTDFENYTKFGAPQITTVTRKHPDDAASFATKVYASYDDKGNITSKIDNYHTTDKQVTTSYLDYNLFGQPKKKQVTAIIDNKVVNITTSYGYDSKGRYIESETGLLGTKKYVYEPFYGNLLSETGVTNLTTTYNYDNGVTLKKPFCLMEIKVQKLVMGWHGKP